MYADAELDSGPRLSERNDARIEPALRWIRATRIDEPTTTLECVSGPYVTCGPRPERPEFTKQLEEQIPGYRRRHSIPPGITGYAQIFGSYDTDASHKLGYDLQYIVNWSLVLDIQILFRTILDVRPKDVTGTPQAGSCERTIEPSSLESLVTDYGQ